MIPGSDDIPSLLAWAEEEALKAHNAAANCPLNGGAKEDCKYEDCDCYPEENCNQKKREAFFNELATRIKNMRCNQRPHVGGRRV